MILFLISLVFVLGYALLIMYYYRGWQSLPEFSAGTNPQHRFLSVVVAARNEQEHIGALLQALAQQSYPRDCFEVVVVDDYSTDRTARTAQESSLPNLVLIRPHVPAAASSKKRAIEAGVQQARGELIVTTDADCLPPVHWLQTLNDFYVRQNACFIAAPVGYSHNQTVLQIFQALDFLTLQGITAATVAREAHAMCNGANLAYTKQSFSEVEGFKGIDQVATGDDMLLMHKIWKQNPGRVFYLKSKEAIVATAPMPGWKDFFRQRKRWASKTFVYDDLKIRVVLVFVYAFNCLFFVLLAAAFFQPLYWWGVGAYLLLKTLVEWPFVSAVAAFFHKQKLMRYFIFLQPLHVFYTVSIGLLSQLGQYEWKGRKTK